MLAHLLRLKGVRSPQGTRKLCDQLLERVNLGEAADRKVGGYSGGMRQRLGIAQAVAGNPRILIVDEPTAGLDPEERQRFYRILAELAEDRIVLLSTHIVEDVSVLCPSFAIIDRGKLIARTTPDAARNAISGRVFQGDISPDDLEALQRDRIVLQTLLVEGRNRVRLLQRDDQPPAGFRAVEATLEDAYLANVQLAGRVGSGGSSLDESSAT